MLLALYTLIVVMLLFGLTIFIHELGHFLVARWYGMKIDAFAVGFGPAIWSKTKNGVLYKIGIIPFGGYVALPQMEPVQDDQPREEAVPDVPPSHKIPVALAGAIGNMILAFIIAWIIYVVGKPSSPHERDTVVGYVEENSSAYEQGLRPGHRIRVVNDERVNNWQDIMVSATLSLDVRMIAENEEGDTFKVLLPTHNTEMGVRLLPGVDWFGYNDVGQTIPGSSAEAAGMQSGDRLMELAGVTLFSQRQLMDLVSKHRDETVPVVVRRDGELVELEVTPRYDPELDRVLIGIMFNPWAVDYDEIIHPKPLAMITEFSSLIFRVLRALVTPSTSGMAAEALAGPVFILKSLWDMVQNSFIMALWFTCLLNVNLAIINLMPLPVLDGGHIAFSLWEMITRRRIYPRLKVALMMACWVLLIGAMIFLSYRDAFRLGWLSGSPAGIEEVQEEDAAIDEDADLPEDPTIPLDVEQEAPVEEEAADDVEVPAYPAEEELDVEDDEAFSEEPEESGLLDVDESLAEEPVLIPGLHP